MFYTLQPFTAHALPITVQAELAAMGKDLQIHFRVQDPQSLILDSLSEGEGAGRRADGLWQSTCLEVFWSEGRQKSYWEFNVSPLTRNWNVYRFDDYRDPQPPALSEDYQIKNLLVRKEELLCTLGGVRPLVAGQASLCAVIRTTTNVHYYSTAHTVTKPDFHQRSSFTLPILNSVHS